MATRVAFLKESLRILPILLAVICLLAPMEAQHGGGGGHSGGGHSGGGRSSGGHASSRHSSSTHSAGGHSGGHFGWLHFGFGKHSVRHAGLGPVPASGISPHGPSRLSNTTRVPSTVRISSTLLSSPLVPRRPQGQASFFASGRRHRDFFFHRYRRFSPSGCFFNGFTQVCFFEPFLPLFSFSGYFDLFDFGFGGDSPDPGDDPNFQGTPQWEMSAAPPTNPSDDNTAKGISRRSPEARCVQRPKAKDLAKVSSSWC